MKLTNLGPGGSARWFPAIRIVPALLVFAGSAGCAGTRERTGRDLWRTHDLARAENAEAAQGQIDPGPTDTTLADYLRFALARNPEIEAARQEWKAALERVPQARTLPDPELGYGYFLQEVETRVGPQRQRLSLTQGFPWFGTLGLRAETAAAGALGAYERYHGVLLATARDVIAAYADYYELGASLGVTRENMDLLAGWERILRARYTAGRANHSDLNRVQVELGKLEDRVTTLERQREPRMARLRSLMNLPAGIVLPWPGSLPAMDELPQREELTALLNANPEFKALEAMVEKETRGIDLARKSYFPRFTLGLDWIQTDPRDVPEMKDNGKDPLVARIGVRVPLWFAGNAAEVREAKARRQAAASRAEGWRRRLESDLESLLFRYDDARRKISLYRDSMIPKGEQSLRAAYTAYEAGENDFLGVLDAERILLEFSLLLERARADETIARAAVLALVGRTPSAE